MRRQVQRAVIGHTVQRAAAELDARPLVDDRAARYRALKRHSPQHRAGADRQSLPAVVQRASDHKGAIVGDARQIGIRDRAVENQCAPGINRDAAVVGEGRGGDNELVAVGHRDGAVVGEVGGVDIERPVAGFGIDRAVVDDRAVAAEIINVAGLIERQVRAQRQRPGRAVQLAVKAAERDRRVVDRLRGVKCDAALGPEIDRTRPRAIHSRRRQAVGDVDLRALRRQVQRAVIGHATQRAALELHARVLVDDRAADDGAVQIERPGTKRQGAGENQSSLVDNGRLGIVHRQGARVRHDSTGDGDRVGRAAARSDGHIIDAARDRAQTPIGGCVGHIIPTATIGIDP